MSDQWRCMIGHVERGEELCTGCVALRNSTIDDILDRVEERESRGEIKPGPRSDYKRGVMVTGGTSPGWGSLRRTR